MPDYNDYYSRFDWMREGKGDPGIGPAVIAGLREGRRDKLERDIQQARNMLELARQQEQTRQFEKEFSLRKLEADKLTSYRQALGERYRAEAIDQRNRADDAVTFQRWREKHIRPGMTASEIRNTPAPPFKLIESHTDWNQMLDSMAKVQSQTTMAKAHSTLEEAVSEAYTSLPPEVQAELRGALKDEDQGWQVILKRATAEKRMAESEKRRIADFNANRKRALEEIAKAQQAVDYTSRGLKGSVSVKAPSLEQARVLAGEGPEGQSIDPQNPAGLKWLK